MIPSSSPSLFSSMETICYYQTWGPSLECPKRFSHPESHSKISDLMITELEIQLSVFTDTDELKMVLREKGPFFMKSLPKLKFICYMRAFGSIAFKWSHSYH